MMPIAEKEMYIQDLLRLKIKIIDPLISIENNKIKEI